MAALQIICAIIAKERVVSVVGYRKLRHQYQSRQKVCKITHNNLKSKNNKLYYIFLMLTTGITLLSNITLYF